jgi:hypothetical protein
MCDFHKENPTKMLSNPTNGKSSKKTLEIHKKKYA